MRPTGQPSSLGMPAAGDGQPRKEWHARTTAEVAEILNTRVDQGLDPEEASRRLGEHGPNELPEAPGPGLLALIWGQLNDFLILLLIGAAVVSFFLREYVDAAVVLAIVVLNAVLGLSQEMKAERALEALRKLAAPLATVIRRGETWRIASREVVSGDLVVLETGDYVPADVRLVASYNLRIDESALTGESVPADKEASAVFQGALALGDRRNSAFSGTIVTYGRGRGLAVATGPHTELGLIAGMLGAIETEPTPLQKALAVLGKALGLITLAVCGVVFLIGLVRGGPLLEEFMIAVSLAVAAVPEGLPAVVTIVLALGMQRMVARHAIIRRLPAVEALGSTTVICSDKTGTLTQNQMTVVRLWTAGGVYRLSGEGYRPTGDFSRLPAGSGAGGEGGNGGEGRAAGNEHVEEPLADPLLRRCLTIGLLCNDSQLIFSGEASGEPTWRLVGDPTEGALVVAARKAGLVKEHEEEASPRVGEVPFEAVRKRMSTLHRTPEGRVLACVKGAPDMLLAHCDRLMTLAGEVALDDTRRAEILDANRTMAGQALRVLGLAYREFEALPDKVDVFTVETGLVFAGLSGMVDPVRPEAEEAVRLCRRAGITPVMVTGDFRDTAVAVGKVLGLDTAPESVMTGDEFAGLSDEELVERARKVSIYARVAPEHKVRIVYALQKGSGHVVAMTGDGVNDALALKRADIGVAMGLSGTDVAKESSAMILTDDNFASIVAAVEEGRTIFNNIRKFVFFLLSCNVGEILIVFLAMVAGLPVPLRPIHLLWLNLVTDSLPALALGLEGAEKDIMARPPRDPREPIINRSMMASIGLLASVEAAVTLGALVWAWRATGDLAFSQTMAFATLITAELLRAYTSRSDRYTIWQLGFGTNPQVVYGTLISFALLLGVLYIPGLNTAFRVVGPSARDWLVIGGLGLVPAVVAELQKLLRAARVS